MAKAAKASKASNQRFFPCDCATRSRPQATLPEDQSQTSLALRGAIASSSGTSGTQLGVQTIFGPLRGLCHLACSKHNSFWVQTVPPNFQVSTVLMGHYGTVAEAYSNQKEHEDSNTLPVAIILYCHQSATLLMNSENEMLHRRQRQSLVTRTRLLSSDTFRISTSFHSNFSGGEYALILVNLMNQALNMNSHELIIINLHEFMNEVSFITSNELTMNPPAAPQVAPLRIARAAASR